MNEKVLFVILEKYADWECAFLSTALQHGIGNSKPCYEVKTVSVTRAPLASDGGFVTVPDYDINSVPEDYAGVILVGGYSWIDVESKGLTEEAQKIVSLVDKTLKDGKMLGAICNGTVFLGMTGFLNNCSHTSNGLDNIISLAKEKYTGHDRYVEKQAVRDNNIVTANGTGYLEFARESLLALKAYPEKEIEEHYNFFKLGLCK